jgi:hypothetical protein
VDADGREVIGWGDEDDDGSDEDDDDEAGLCRHLADDEAVEDDQSPVDDGHFVFVEGFPGFAPSGGPLAL